MSGEPGRDRGIFDCRPLSFEGGSAKRGVANVFTDALIRLEQICGQGGREMALVRTKLQEAKMWADQSIAAQVRFHDTAHDYSKVPPQDD